MRLDYVARPAGTKPAAVYWRRRLVVFGVLLLLLWFAAKACGGSGSSPSRAAGASQAAKTPPSTSSSARTTASGNGDVPSAAAVGTPGSTASGNSASASGSTAPVTSMCDGSTLSLRAAVDRLSFHRPFTAGITLQIATRSSIPCGLAAGALSAQVLDGSRVLWSSDGCPDLTAAAAGGGAASDSASTAGNAATAGQNTASSGGADRQNVITVPSQSAADQHYTWHGTVCSGQLAPGRYDVVGRLGLAQAFAGTVTVT
jgi:hypothetical protein